MLTPIADIVGGDETDTQLLRAMAVKARDYIASFKWCLPIKAAYFVDGYGGVVALFLFEFTGKIDGTDDRLWVIVGDLPSAYMIVEPDDSARLVLEGYCGLMGDWVNAVLVTHDFESVFPVEAARTPGNAESLRSRLDILRREVIPEMTTDPVGSES